MRDMILRAVMRQEAYQKLVYHIEQGDSPAALFGVSSGVRPIVAAALAKRFGSFLYVAHTPSQAQRVYQEMSQLIDGVVYFPEKEPYVFGAQAQSMEATFDRIRAIDQLASGAARIAVCSMDALLTATLPKAVLEEAKMCVCPGDILEIDAFVEHLITCGYEQTQLVEARGQMARRGGILDIFPTNSQSAVRIEFFDDEVDTVRTFDVGTQRSLEALDEMTLLPASEAVMFRPPHDLDGLKTAIEAVSVKQTNAEPLAAKTQGVLPEEIPDEDELPALWDMALDFAQPRHAGMLFEHARLLENGQYCNQAQLYLPWLYDSRTLLVDYLPGAVVIAEEPGQMKERCDSLNLEFQEALASAQERGQAVAQQSALLLSWSEMVGLFERSRCVTVNQLIVNTPDFAPKALLEMQVQSAPSYHGRLDLLCQDLKQYRAQYYSTLLLTSGTARAQRLIDTLDKHGIGAGLFEPGSDLSPGNVLILPLNLSSGFVLPDERLLVLGEEELFGQVRVVRRTKARAPGRKIQAFTDLTPGDYVVHDSHGVGVFVGMVKMEVDGKRRDYLHLRYNGTDKLYIPTDQMDRVQKYIGNTESPPRLNKLGGNEWERQKAKVRKSVRTLAFDLVALYARRQNTKGFAFGTDTPWQREFEDKFPFEETPDQLRCIEEIKLDMEREICMDRLLCGDVGYGKTEVALRAAFKAVMSNKQVAMLVPTTVLAQQHYQSILKRFEGFPVRVQMLSRFRTAAEQKKILADLKAGEVDIVVGTHRLLGKEVQFKDLGLLIIDEEQRFGVAHKEKIKLLKESIDVLTLSATPIPRTLHMSMVGIRDLSTIETPPEDRYPVQTSVSYYSDALTREAIERELGRGGQVYIVYNQVVSIERFAAHLRQIVPQARIVIAHGQMPENQLEDVMMDFMDGKYDVLLCSTIIESGLDIAKANTMVIIDADRFGLSQLYQLRGRVGRSNRLAYCYLTVRPNKVLSEIAQKRLTAIKEFTQFGSGFKIAMRDLELRGAGNIIGAQQSGHMASVGYDMYVKLIDEAVREVSGKGIEQRYETSVNLPVDAYLPEDFVRGSDIRMDIYKLIAQVGTNAQREDCMDELFDRFGDLPNACENLVYIAYIKNQSQRIGTDQVFLRRNQIVLRFNPHAQVDTEKLVRALGSMNGKFILSAASPPALLYPVNQTVDKTIRELAVNLERFCDMMLEDHFN